MSSYWIPYYEARDMDRDWEEVGRDWGRSGVFAGICPRILPILSEIGSRSALKSSDFGILRLLASQPLDLLDEQL